jgi:general stress protein YciG
MQCEEGSMNYKEFLSKYFSEIGRKGGNRTSEAKAQAVRNNGKKGGRPKGQFKYKQET